MMLTPFADSARALASGPLTWRTWTGLIALPVLVMGLLTWAFWSPDTDHDTATAAVVNNDEPANVNGRLLPLGRELAGKLTHSTDSPYTWVLTDAADAEDGLADGSYAAVVTIPEDFSARATSSAVAKPRHARQGVVDIVTSARAGVADPVVSAQVARATQQALDDQIVATYLDNIYSGFTTIHGQVNQAAAAARELAGGTGQLRASAARLATGAGELSTATGQLATGAGQLADGLDQAEQETAELPARTSELAAGAAEVARGSAALAAAVQPLGAASSAPDLAAFQRLVGQCPASGAAAEYCAALADAASQLAATATQTQSALTQASQSVQALAAGARQVADGNAELAARTPALTQGIADAAAGARRLDTGAQQVDAGARQLASGAQQLSAGTVKVDDGARQLASALGGAQGQVPSYTDDEREHLSHIAADPTTANVDDPRIGPLGTTLFASLALWSLALATYLVTRAVPESVLTARAATWRIIVRAALPGATAAALAAVAVTAIAAPVLGLGFGRVLGFLGIALLASGAFVALNQAVTAILGRTGRLVSVAVLVLAVATGVVSTLPGPLYALADFLPTHGAVEALRAVALGGPGLARGIVELVVWLGIGVLATILVTDRRRYLSARRLRTRSPRPA